jgi:hypothetical protein
MDTDVEMKTDLPAREHGVVTELAKLPPQAHVDSQALGQMLGRCKKSVQRAVRRGELPPPFKFMGRHVWLVKTLLEHMQGQQDAVLQEMNRRAAILGKQRV